MIRPRPARTDAPPLDRQPQPARGAILRVLVYHRVADPALSPDLDPALVSATPDDFRRQMQHLARRYRVVSLEEVLHAFQGRGSLPRRAVLLTFDDAYRDFGENAWPILRELGLTATLFVPTAYPGNSNRAFWWDRLHRFLHDPARASKRGPATEEGRRIPADVSRIRGQLKGLPHGKVEEVVEKVVAELVPRSGAGAPGDEPPPVLDWSQLRELAREGVSLGAHTRRHPPLPRETEERIREEMRGSLEDLRAAVGDVPAVIAYPYGFHDEEVVRIAREEGFELGFTCLDGLNRVGVTDPLRLCRTNLTRNTTPFLFRLRMRPWFAAVDRWRHRDQPSSGVEPEASAEALLDALTGALPGAAGERR